MRPVKLLLAIACCISALPAATDQAIETRKVQAVSLERILETPDSFQGVSVRFPGVWIGLGNLFDTQRSHFHAERYVNFAVWSDRARLWEPSARAQPIATLYMSKDQPGADRPAAFKRYQPVEIEGKVVAVMDGQPWIDVVAIRAIEKHGAFSESAIAQLERAVAFSAEEAHDLAEEHFAAALAADLPGPARVTVSDMRAHSLMAAGRWSEAADILRSVMPSVLADSQMANASKASMHAALARCLGESANGDANVYVEAIAEARLAVGLDPSLSEAYAVLGISLACLGRFDEARLQCDRAVRLRPDDATVRLALGRILDQQGRHDEAIEALKRAIDLTPKDARVHRAIATAYLGRGRTGDVSDLPIAYKECDITLRLAPQDAEAHWLAGQIVELAVARTAELSLPGGKAVPTLDLARERYKAALAIDAKFEPAKAALQALDGGAAKAAEPAAQPAPAAEPAAPKPAP